MIECFTPDPASPDPGGHRYRLTNDTTGKVLELPAGSSPADLDAAIATFFPPEVQPPKPGLPALLQRLWRRVGRSPRA